MVVGVGNHPDSPSPNKSSELAHILALLVRLPIMNNDNNPTPEEIAEMIRNAPRFDPTEHPLHIFATNHPEFPDVYNDEPLDMEMFDRAFDGEWLIFSERMMLAMDEVCYQRSFDPELAPLSDSELQIIARYWATDAEDYLMVLDDMRSFTEPL